MVHGQAPTTDEHRFASRRLARPDMDDSVNGTIALSFWSEVDREPVPMMEFDEWVDADGDVCVDCVNKDLAGWIVTEVVGTASCSFCSRTGYTASVRELFEYMQNAICRDWSPESLSTQVPSSRDFQEFQPPRIQSGELLFELGDPLGHGSDLTEMFCRVFPEDWIHDDHWAGTRSENLEWSWARFSDQVKSKTRFLVLREDPELHTGGAETPPHKMLDQLGEIFERTELVRTLPGAEHILRGRKHPQSTTFATTSELGAPNAQHAGAQRMSPAGISFFYASMDAATCLAELRGRRGEVATVGEWRPERLLVVLDLADRPTTPGVFDSLYGDVRELALFTSWFVGQITKPILAHHRPEVDYIPSQVVAEYIRYTVTDDNGELIDGIRFPSVANPGGINLALFNGPDLHESSDPILKLVKTQKWKVDSAAVEWSPEVP